MAQQHTVYIGNLPLGTADRQLRELFSQWGVILEVRIAKTANGQPRGYGFVDFASNESAEKAVAEGYHQNLEGHRITVAKSRSKSKDKVEKRDPSPTRPERREQRKRDDYDERPPRQDDYHWGHGDDSSGRYRAPSPPAPRVKYEDRRTRKS
jgi:RNA recognition motif-containing protein